MQLSQMRYFLEIVKTGNISAAARNLFLSQPSLSQSIKSLEEELGVRLLIRHSKSVSLTDAGEQFASHAARIVGSSEQLIDLMQKHSQLLSGNLRLGIPWIAGYLGLFTLLRRYHQAMPGIKYELSIQGSGSLLQQLTDRSIHGGFIVSTAERLMHNTELYYKKINEEHYMAWIPREKPLSEKAALSIPDLDGEQVIMPATNTIFSKQLDQLVLESGISPQILCRTSQTDIIRQLTGEGLAIGFASSSIAKKNCPDTCRAVPLEVQLARTIFYVTLNELLDYPTIESFTNYVEHYIFD